MASFIYRGFYCQGMKGTRLTLTIVTIIGAGARCRLEQMLEQCVQGKSSGSRRQSCGKHWMGGPWASRCWRHGHGHGFVWATTQTCWPGSSAASKDSRKDACCRAYKGDILGDVLKRFFHVFPKVSQPQSVLRGGANSIKHQMQHWWAWWTRAIIMLFPSHNTFFAASFKFRIHDWVALNGVRDAR